MPLPGKQMPGHAARQLDQRRRPWRLVPCHEFLFVVPLPFSPRCSPTTSISGWRWAHWLNILLLGVGLEAGAWYGRTTLVPGDDRQALSRLATFRAGSWRRRPCTRSRRWSASSAPRPA
jgi:hypothetical protein